MSITPAERAKQLAEEHWNGYVGELLRAFGVNAVDADGFNFISAFKHGYKHAVEDIRAGLFPSIPLDRYNAIHTPLPAEEVERFSKEVVPENLCGSCGQETCSAEMMWKCGETGKCDRYTSNFREQIAEAKEPQPLDLSLPSITLECTAEEAWDEYMSERQEWKDTEDAFEELVEKWDCLQAYQTFREKGGKMGSLGDHNALAAYHEEGRPVMQAKAAMLLKNATRPNPSGGTGYYSPEVCKIIIESNGHRFTP